MLEKLITRFTMGNMVMLKKPRFTRFVQNVLFSSLDQPASREMAYIVNIFSILGLLATAIFGSLHIVIEHNQLVGYLELAGSCTMALNMIGLRLTKNVVLARNLLLLSIFSLLIVMLATGGIQGTGIFWFFIFPPAAFFLVGKLHGVMWVGALYGAVLLLVGLAQLGLARMPYSLVTIRQLLVSLFVVTFSMYIYQHSRERAEAKGRESQQDLQEYLDNMTTLNAKLAPDGTILFANAIAKQATGLGERVLGADFLDGQWWRFDPAVHERVRAAFAKALTGEKISYDERIQAAMADGSRVLSINLSMIPISSGGRIKYILVEAHDISAELEVERAKSEFVTLASHQLRTPMSAIKWFSEMLLSGDAGKLSEEQLDYIKQVYGSNLRLTAMVDSMLMVASLELGKLQVRPEPTDLAQLCQRLLADQLHIQQTSKELTINEAYDPSLPKVPVDRTAMKTVLANVLSNAIKYTPAGGKVSIKVTTSDEKLSAQSKGSVRIAIADTGYGIPSDQQKIIFVKLFRAANIKEKDTDGTGLGLYIVKALLEQVGGRISFTSEEGKGSTFVILLPLEGMKPHTISDQPSGEA